MNGHFWEPWHPVVGQRVRIGLSAECCSPHVPADGVNGVVVGVDSMAVCQDEDRSEPYWGHRYWVNFDALTYDPDSGRFIKGDCFTPLELEALG